MSKDTQVRNDRGGVMNIGPYKIGKIGSEVLTGSMSAKGPLRKIVDWYTDEKSGLRIEVFECGHSRPTKQDIYGPTNAERRRCRECARERR